MENIGHFLNAAEELGCNKTDLFQTVDLYEKTNMWQVVCGIHAFGRKVLLIFYILLYVTTFNNLIQYDHSMMNNKCNNTLVYLVQVFIGLQPYAKVTT